MENHISSYLFSRLTNGTNCLQELLQLVEEMFAFSGQLAWWFQQRWTNLKKKLWNGKVNFVVYLAFHNLAFTRNKFKKKQKMPPTPGLTSRIWLSSSMNTFCWSGANSRACWSICAVPTHPNTFYANFRCLWHSPSLIQTFSCHGNIAVTQWYSYMIPYSIRCRQCFLSLFFLLFYGIYIRLKNKKENNQKDGNFNHLIMNGHKTKKGKNWENGWTSRILINIYVFW